ncbi:MAG: hypothetical protein A2Z64_02585 [Betaproteobacteria bacterium RIFCSPLOWO2_02_67_12]|nr:MAG: hypothetical protein A2Z64_02585 [Betaproteobacteria bacterium RIFCSPLOWO2_02_67_12]
MSDERDARPHPPPEYELFYSEAAFQAAVDRLLAQDGRELRIFDPDLAPLRLNSPERVARIERFLQSSRTRRLYLATHDTSHLSGHCPRMTALFKRFSHAIQVQRTHDEIRELRDSFLVLDALQFVRRPEAASWRGVICLDDRNEAYAMHARFQEIWAASYPAVPPTTLGL